MNELTKRIAALSPEHRALFERQLKQKDLQRLTKQTIPRRKNSDELPLSFAQQRLWFLNQLTPDSPSYNIHIVWRFTGRLNVATLERSINEIVRRHESLRVTFANVEQRASQVISPVQTLTLPVVNLQELPEIKRKSEFHRLAREEAKKPFDLAQGPLLRVTLLHLSEQEQVLLLTMHHIVADGWSRGVFLRELGVLYKAFFAGKPSPLPELPIQYIDFAIWQRQWLQGEELNTQLSYWKQQLDNLPMLELPKDRVRPAIQTFRGAIQSFILPTQLAFELKALSRQEGVTLFMALLAAFKTLLHRYSGQDDIVVGSPIASRNWAEIEGLIGFFVNTLVLRTDLSGNPTFRELLKREKEVASGAYKHQDLPFARLVEELQPERNLSYNPLFQVAFQLQNEAYQFQNSQTPVLELPDLTLSQLWFDKESTQFDLSWHMAETAEGLLTLVEYSTDLFNNDTITRMLEHFRILLEGIAANPEQHLSQLPLLTEVEKHQLLVQWNNTQINYPVKQCIHKLFEEQVERSPDAVAVVFEDEQLTYHELNARANQLAHYLRYLGVGPEVLVGICVERSLSMLIGLLGILKAGGAYVPLDPTYPQERLSLMLSDSQVRVLLTQKKLMAGILKHQAHVVCLDTDENLTVAGSEENPVSDVQVSNLAYVIYTSGSTGKPKGVMISHQAICNHMFWMQKSFPLTETDKVLQKTPFSFDASIWEFYAPLLVGAQLIIARPEGHQDSAYLVKLITNLKVTTVQLVPSLLRIFLEEVKIETCNSLKRVFCGGEVLPIDIQERFLAKLNADLYNLYGPTEACIDATFWACKRESDLPIVPIGRPITNTQVYLLDCEGQPVPIGVPGELHIGGDGLARGYLNRPELTAEKFIPNPFSNEAGARLYKTGDLVRYDLEGNLNFLSRLDYQVKIRGFRIEIGEIEAVLRQYPGVQESVVVVREDEPEDKRLVAYVVPQPEHVLTISELRHFLENKLPKYMVPSAFMMQEALPLTFNGKIDRRKLPAPENARPELEAAYVMPRTEGEQMIATVWREALNLETVGIHDNFFELGGHSLLLVKVNSQMREIFKIDLSILEMFRYPTISSLAEYLSQTSEQSLFLSNTEIQTEKLKQGISRIKQRFNRSNQKRDSGVKNHE